MDLIKRTGADDYPDKLKMLISGPAKSGKSTALGSIPNIVIADTEPHANNLQSIAHLNIPYVTINELDDLKRLLVVLRDPTLRKQAAESLRMPAIEAVAIDTLDTLQQIMKIERLKETHQTQFMRDDWAWLREEMVAIIRAFTALPLHCAFTVHTKSASIGFGDDERNIVLPGLQGSIAEDIAGMVGYSLYCFRRQEIAPDGTPYIKYWMRTEGDEVFTFLGNRAAGQLPSIIEPDFKTIRMSAMKGRTRVQESSTPPPVSQPAVQAVPAPQVAAVPARPITPQPQQQAPASGDDPITPKAMEYVKKIFDALGLGFPEQKVSAMTLGDARSLVQLWQACQADEAEGKTDAKATMLDLLQTRDLLDVGLNINATIDEVLAQVGTDPALISEAITAEHAKAKPRVSLLTKLDALLRTVQNQPVQPVVQPVVQPEPQPEPVAPEAVQAPVPDESVAIPDSAAAALAALDADVLSTSHCENCGNPIDDQSIATLARARFQKSLCINCYIATTKSA